MRLPTTLLFIVLSAPLAMFLSIDFVLSRPIFSTTRLAAPRPAPSPDPPLPSPTFHRHTPPLSSHPPPPPPPSGYNESFNYTPFKPSVAVVVAVLTTMFSITFLLLLYAKHCKRGGGSGGVGGGGGGSFAAFPVSGRKNSGIDRAVIESLPVFRFASLSGEKDGLECAVCLNRFEPADVLRLLPKCKHAFHVECVDTWLDAHSTCPLCRYRVDPEDVLLVETTNHPLAGLIPEEEQDGCGGEEQEQQRKHPASSDSTTRKSFPEPGRRISGRHSYAGMSSSTSNPPAFRKSHDGPQQRLAVAMGCFDRHRKDGMLFTAADRERERRLGHRIIIAAAGKERWSDVQSADLLYLPRESVMKEGRRSSAASSSSKGDGVQPQGQ